MSCGSEVSVGKHPKFHRENLQKHVIGLLITLMWRHPCSIASQALLYSLAPSQVAYSKAFKKIWMQTSC